MLPVQAKLLHIKTVSLMDLVSLVGFGMLIVFLIAVIVLLSKDNIKEKRNYHKWDPEEDDDT
jgi:hypothetical protein